MECHREGCDNRTKFGEILVKKAMVVNMYDQENMTRVMEDHMVLNTYEKK